MARKGKKKTQGEGNPASVKKSKSFKRIRGLLTGESRRERKARKARESAAASNAAASSDVPDDASTVFGVDVDERSVATGAVANSTADSFLKGAPEPTENKEDKKAYILKVVLLLMDPETRRFELLQLEFDSLKALVSDVLAQIPVSVTEEALRVQSYTGIAGKDGTEMPPSKLLATFCKGNEVLVAIPSGVDPKECTRLARPILSDEKVVDMLASSGIDAAGWKEDVKKKKKKSALKKSTEAIAEEAAGETKESSSSKVFTIAFIVLVAILLQVFHVYISDPIKLGSTISPGIWLSKCGLLTVLPSCENAYLHVGKDGVVTHYDSSKEVTWKMEGSVCDVDDDDDESDCVPGMQVQEDGKIIIGGKPISRVTTYGQPRKLPSDFFSPWPFVDAPKLKVWRK